MSKYLAILNTRRRGEPFGCFVHPLSVVLLVGWSRSKKMRRTIRLTVSFGAHDAAGCLWDFPRCERVEGALISASTRCGAGLRAREIETRDDRHGVHSGQANLRYGGGRRRRPHSRRSPLAARHLEGARRACGVEQGCRAIPGAPEVVRARSGAVRGVLCALSGRAASLSRCRGAGSSVSRAAGVRSERNADASRTRAPIHRFLAKTKGNRKASAMERRTQTAHAVPRNEGRLP